MTNVGTPISRLFVISTSACASIRAGRSSSSSRDPLGDCISRSQYRLRMCIGDVLHVRDDHVTRDELDEEPHGRAQQAEVRSRARSVIAVAAEALEATSTRR